MALINQAPSTIPYQAQSTGYGAQTTSAQQATATGYTPTNAEAKTATSKGYDANSFQVTPEQTVEGRLGGIIAADSPLMQQARTRALQYANSRGLINSSLAAGEAQARMVDAAMPIAQQDAGAFNQAMTNTVNAKNTASQFGANASNTAELTNAQLGTNVNLANQNAQNAAAGFKATADNNASLTNAQLGTNVNLANQNAVNTANQFGANAFNSAALTNAQLGTNVNLANMDAQTKVAIANLDSQTKSELAAIDGNYKQLLQTNQDAASAFNQVTQNLAAISQNASLSPEAKDAARTQQLNMLNELLRQQSHVASTPTGSIGGLNLGGYFGAGDYGGTGGTESPGTGSNGVGSTPPPAGTGGTGSGGSTPTPTAPTSDVLQSGPFKGYRAIPYAQYPNSGVSFIPDLGGWFNGIHAGIFPTAEAAMQSLG